MKPNFALSLSFDGLRLMHRVTRGWHLVGEVALDDADLTGSLAQLRDAALDLEGGELATKLLIPNDQIKYLALDTTRAEDADVRDALQGATPYTVDELAYDFAKGGGRTYVAAVAQVTLDEAYQFAAEHGFNPVCFAAVPEPFTFVGEAFFGAANNSDAERDADAVVVVGTSAAQRTITAAHDVEPDGTNADDAPPPVEQDAATEPDAEADTTAPAEAEADIEFSAEDQTGSDPAPEAADPAEQPAETESAQDGDPTDDATDMPVFGSLRADRSEGRPSAPTKPSPPLGTFPRRTEPTLAVPKDGGNDSAPTLSASRKADAPAAAPANLTTEPPEPQEAPPITGGVPAPDVAAASLTIEPDPLDEDDPEDDTSGSVASASSGMFASRRMARGESAQAGGDTSDGKAKLTVFGARKQPKPKTVVGGKPRFLGLILTAVLLLFLLAMAAFAALSEEGFARWFGLGSDDTQIAQPDVLPDASPVDTPEPETASAAVDVPPVPAPPAVAATGTVLTPEEANRIYATTGVWQRAPRIAVVPRTTSIDDLVLDVASRPVTRVPPSPLVDAGSVGGDALIAMPIDPPPPSATFDFNDDGLVVATENGAVTPDGILVISGRPDLEPPARPGTVAPEITPQDQLAAVIPDTAAPVPDAPDGVIVISGAPQILPPARPASAVPQAADPVVPAPQDAAVTDTTPVPEQPFVPTDPDALAEAALAAVIPAENLPIPDVQPDTSTDAPPAGLPDGVPAEGLNIIAGQPPVLPPARPAPVATPPADGGADPALDAVVAQVPVTPETPELAATDSPAATPDPLPEGLNVVAGSPPVLPPARPGTAAPQDDASLLPPARPGTAAPQDDASLEDLTQEVATALLEPDAADVVVLTPQSNTPRPAPRPTGLDEAVQAAVAVPAVDPALAGFRPQTRPAGLAPPPPAPEVPEPAVAEAPAPLPTLQISPEIAAAVQAAANRPNPIVNPTAQAVPVSSRPDPRPRNMARIVERANQAATQVAAAPQQVAPRAIQPSGPTGNAVAQNATLENAINLRDVNLMGIYGSNSDRRALVRLGNGNFLRVTVGDRLDGGRVTAISANALSYTKRGRAITLQVGG